MSYRDLEEILAERGLGPDHTTVSRWVRKFAPERFKKFNRRGAMAREAPDEEPNRIPVLPELLFDHAVKTRRRHLQQIGSEGHGSRTE